MDPCPLTCREQSVALLRERHISQRSPLLSLSALISLAAEHVKV